MFFLASSALTRSTTLRFSLLAFVFFCTNALFRPLPTQAAQGRYQTKLRASRTFQRTHEYPYFQQQLRASTQPWQQEIAPCGWELHIHLTKHGKASFRYGFFYRSFRLPKTSTPEVRGRTLLLLLGLFWEAALQEQQAGSFSCRQRKMRILSLALPGTLPDPPPPRRKTPIPPKKSLIPPKPPPEAAPTTKPVTAPIFPPTTAPATKIAILPPQPTTKPLTRPSTPAPQRGFEIALGLSVAPYFGFDGEPSWSGTISAYLWPRERLSLWIELVGAQRQFYTAPRGGLTLAQASLLGAFVPWKTRYFALDLHLGLNWVFAWSLQSEGGYAWTTPGIQGGLRFVWRPFSRLSLFLRLDAVYFPFVSPAREDATKLHLQSFYLVPLVGFSWRF